MTAPDDPGGPSSLSRAELREATLAGVRWVTLARLVAEVTALGASVVLARLIPPAEFGRAAIALLAAAVAGVVMSQAIGAAVIQARDVARADLQTATLLALVAGLGFAGLTLVLGEVLIDPVLGERIAVLMQLSSGAFLLGSFGAVSQALLHRRLGFQRLAVVQVTALLCATGASVTLAAVAELDGEALVAGSLTGTGVASILSVVMVRPERPRLDRAAARRITSFGVNSGLAALFYTVFRRIDYVILAARLSAADVGYYWRAYQLGVEYQSKITTVMLRITFPVFSRTASLDDMRAIRARTVRLHGVLVLPTLAAFIAMAPVLVPWLYGETWEPSVGPAQLLAIVGMGAAIVTGVGPLLLAAGRPRVLMVYNLVTLALYAATVYMLAPEGITAVCVGVLAVQALNFAATQYFLLQRIIGIPVRDLFADVAPGGSAALAILALTYPLVDRMSNAGVEPVLTLAAATVVATGVAVGAVRTLFPAAWADVMLGVRSVRSKRRA